MKRLASLFLLAAAVAKASVTLTIPLSTAAPRGASVRMALVNCQNPTIVNSGTSIPLQQTFPVTAGATSVTVTVPDNVTQIACDGNQFSYYTVTYIAGGVETLLKSVELPQGTFNLANLANLTGPPWNPGVIQGPPGPAGAGTLLSTNGTQNGDQTQLNLVAGSNITLANVNGTTTITSNLNPSGSVISINGNGGNFNFTGSGVSCSGVTCTFSGGGGSVTSVTASGGLASSGGATPNITPASGYTIPTTGGTNSQFLAGDGNYYAVSPACGGYSCVGGGQFAVPWSYTTPPTITADMTSSATTMTISSTSGFPSTGACFNTHAIGVGGTEDEAMCYTTVVDGTHLGGLHRGLYGTTAVAHTAAHAAAVTGYSYVNANGSNAYLPYSYTDFAGVGVIGHTVYGAAVAGFSQAFQVLSGGAYIQGGLVADSITDNAITAGTSPICPNGTAGAFTTVGCAVGGNATLGLLQAGDLLVTDGASITAGYNTGCSSYANGGNVCAYGYYVSRSAWGSAGTFYNNGVSGQTTTQMNAHFTGGGGSPTSPSALATAYGCAAGTHKCVAIIDLTTVPNNYTAGINLSTTTTDLQTAYTNYHNAGYKVLFATSPIDGHGPVPPAAEIALNQGADLAVLQGTIPSDFYRVDFSGVCPDQVGSVCTVDHIHPPAYIQQQMASSVINSLIGNGNAFSADPGYTQWPITTTGTMTANTVVSLGTSTPNYFLGQVGIGTSTSASALTVTETRTGQNNVVVVQNNDATKFSSIQFNNSSGTAEVAAGYSNASASPFGGHAYFSSVANVDVELARNTSTHIQLESAATEMKMPVTMDSTATVATTLCVGCTTPLTVMDMVGNGSVNIFGMQNNNTSGYSAGEARFSTGSRGMEWGVANASASNYAGKAYMQGDGVDLSLGSNGTYILLQHAGGIAVSQPIVSTSTGAFSHLISAGTSPTVAFGTGAGTSPTSTSISGHDTAFNVTFTTGSTPASSAVIATVTFGTAFASAPYCTFSAANINAGPAIPNMFITATTTTAVLNSTTTALTATLPYSLNVHCIQ